MMRFIENYCAKRFRNKVIHQAAKFLMDDEGFSDRVYKDTNKFAIGYGENLPNAYAQIDTVFDNYTIDQLLGFWDTNVHKKLNKYTMIYKPLEDYRITEAFARKVLYYRLATSFASATHLTKADSRGDADFRKLVIALCMIYNVGYGGFSNFLNYHSHCENGDWIGAGKELFNSRWRVQVGSRRAIKYIDYISKTKGLAKGLYSELESA